MRVLGLDPGLTCAGYGLVERVGGSISVVDYGAIRTSGDIPVRLLALFDRVDSLMRSYAPDAVAIERVVFNANTRTAMSVGQAAGVVMVAAARAGCEIAEYTPGEVKLSVTGFGSADKRQVQTMIQRLLSLDEIPEPADAADALGLALTHLQARKLRKVQRGA